MPKAKEKTPQQEDAELAKEAAGLYEPLDDRVLVLVDRPKDTFKDSEIIVPDAAIEKPNRGVVVAVGTGRIVEGTVERAPMELKMGQVVLYSPYAGSDVELDVPNKQRRLKLLREADVLCRLKG